MTGRVNPAIVSFLVAGCQSRERLRLIDAHSPIVQAHILARPDRTLEFSMSDMTVLSTKTGESCGRCLLIQYDSAKLSAISVDEEKKSPEKAGNESFGK